MGLASLGGVKNVGLDSTAVEEETLINLTVILRLQFDWWLLRTAQMSKTDLVPSKIVSYKSISNLKVLSIV